MFSLWIKNLEFIYVFEESSSTYTGNVFDFFNEICVFLIYITFLVSFWMIFILINFIFKKNLLININNINFILLNNLKTKIFFYTSFKDRQFNYLSINDIKDCQELEGTWSLVPLTFVMSTAYPSVALEYGICPDITPFVDVKITAYQWYWVVDVETKVSTVLYEVEDPFFFNNESSLLFELFYSNVYLNKNTDKFWEEINLLNDYTDLRKHIELRLVNSLDTNPDFLRMLSLNEKLVLPINTPIRFIVTSGDVIHSLAIPSATVKMDAVPGRLSQQVVVFDRPGIIWGLCSELCGPYHSSMPVVFEITSFDVFMKYMLQNN